MENNDFVPGFGFMIKRGKVVNYSKTPPFKKVNLKKSLINWIKKLI